jgi:hypothetical protein
VRAPRNITYGRKTDPIHQPAGLHMNGKNHISERSPG